MDCSIYMLTQYVARIVNVKNVDFQTLSRLVCQPSLKSHRLVVNGCVPLAYLRLVHKNDYPSQRASVYLARSPCGATAAPGDRGC